MAKNYKKVTEKKPEQIANNYEKVTEKNPLYLFSVGVFL
jgi:hypothetical protein